MRIVNRSKDAIEQKWVHLNLHAAVFIFCSILKAWMKTWPIVPENFSLARNSKSLQSASKKVQKYPKSASTSSTERAHSLEQTSVRVEIVFTMSDWLWSNICGISISFQLVSFRPSSWTFLRLSLLCEVERFAWLIFKQTFWSRMNWCSFHWRDASKSFKLWAISQIIFLKCYLVLFCRCENS